MATWYGINGATGGGGCWTCAPRWPFQRWPADVGDIAPTKQLDSHREPATIVAIYDGVWMHNGTIVNVNNIRGVHARHGGGERCNVLFLDGHVDSVLTSMMQRDNTNYPKLRW